MPLLAVWNDYPSNYSKLLKSFGSVSMESRWLRCTTYKISKISNDLNPNLVKIIFYSSPDLIHRKDGLCFSWDRTKFLKESLSLLGTHCLKTLSKHLKSTKSLYKSL